MLLTIAAIVLWLLSNINLGLHFGYLGLINGLPLLLLIAVLLLTVAAILNWKTDEPSDTLAILQLVILGIMLWGTVLSFAGSFNVEFDKFCKQYGDCCIYINCDILSFVSFNFD